MGTKVDNFKMWSGKRLTAEKKTLDIMQRTLAKLNRLQPAVISMWESETQMPTEKIARNVQAMIEKLKRIQQIHAGVKVDMNDRKFVRSELRKLGDGSTADIPQEWGVRFAIDWCEKFDFTPAELIAACQFHPRVLRATILSAPAQRWLRAVTAAIEKVLSGVSLTEYSAKFPDRHAAVTKVANQAFAELLAEVGKEKITEYLAAMLTTGELRQAPRDFNEN